ncbi:NAD-dependent epimerase/dehydratase family protein [Nguyenibacter vanlangensis]|uniref:NAD-dependent epimerase/dehydratase family protein n=1 Tax=Nguyenibacter vanlangensis TaxID=1216886 RepID=A0ABZ3D9C2_9PROT
MTIPGTALIIGARGGIGRAAAGTLLRHGWRVRGLVRGTAPGGASHPPPIEWVVGNAMDSAAVMAAARGADAVIHAVNPPGYRHWDRLVMPMLENSIAAAQAADARLVLPGTVYNFGPDAGCAPDEDAPQNPLTRKGGIRVAMERRLHDAARGGLRALIVRTGDFFGPGAGNNWFSQGLLGNGRPVRALTDPGRPGVGHQWAYLPDVAETIARLLAREEALERMARFHMAGHWDPDGRHMIAAIRQALGDPDMRVRRFPWWLVGLIAPAVPFCRELHEMRYLWRTGLRLGNARLLGLLGSEPHTRLDIAVHATLQALDAFPQEALPRHA